MQIGSCTTSVEILTRNHSSVLVTDYKNFSYNLKNLPKTNIKKLGIWRINIGCIKNNLFLQPIGLSFNVIWTKLILTQFRNGLSCTGEAPPSFSPSISLKTLCTERGGIFKLPPWFEMQFHLTYCTTEIICGSKIVLKSLKPNKIHSIPFHI